jgi:hypothetical protein
MRLSPLNRRTLFALAIGLTLIGVGEIVLLSRPSRVTRENFQRIQPGMKRAEVEAIFSRPPDGFDSNPVPLSADSYPIEEPSTTAYALDWMKGDDTISVGFNDTGEVTQVMFLTEVSINEGLMETLRWRLQRPWRWLP